MPGENRLGDGRAGEQSGQGEGEEGAHGDQRRAQRVTGDRLALDQALGARRAHVVGPEGVEHEVALVAGVGGDPVERHGDRRQQQVLGAPQDPRALAHELEVLPAERLVGLDGAELEE